MAILVFLERVLFLDGCPTPQQKQYFIYLFTGILSACPLPSYLKYIHIEVILWKQQISVKNVS